MSNVTIYGAPFPRTNKKRRRRPGEPPLPTMTFRPAPVSPRATPGEPIGNVGRGTDASAELALANYHAMRAFSLALADAPPDQRKRLVQSLKKLNAALADLALALDKTAT